MLFRRALLAYVEGSGKQGARDVSSPFGNLAKEMNETGINTMHDKNNSTNHPYCLRTNRLRSFRLEKRFDAVVQFEEIGFGDDGADAVTREHDARNIVEVHGEQDDRYANLHLSQLASRF